MALTKETEIPYRTGTETLIAAMEEFGQSEPKAVVVIYANEDGEVLISGNTGKCMALGLIETGKAIILSGGA